MSEGNIRLFFVGRSWNGVTSTIKSFLSENKHQVTSKSTLYQIYKDDVYVVVDGSGIGDSIDDMEHSEEEVEQSLACILKEIGEDFEAIVFVYKYSVRFTKQEKDAVIKVKQYFGENIFKERGIIVLTYGDNFDLDNNQSFEEWCNQQTGTFNELLSTCNGRIVLFNNRTKVVHQVNKQKEQLKQAVESLRTTKPDIFSSVPALLHKQAVEDQRNIKPDIKSPIPALLHEQAVGINQTVFTGYTKEKSVRPSKTEQSDVAMNDGDQTSNSSTQLVPESKPSSEADHSGGSNEEAGMAETPHVNTNVQKKSHRRHEDHRDPEPHRRHEDHRDPEPQRRHEDHRDPECQDPMQAMLVEIKVGNRRMLWCLSFAIFVICGIGAVICLKLFHVI